MGDVVDLFGKKPSGHNFMCCGCRPNDPQPLVPIVDLDAPGVTIVGVMCPECESFLTVVDGRVRG